MSIVHVYQVGEHLIVNGDTKKIRKELKDTYYARWQPDPFNMWLIPNTDVKTFIKNKSITAIVSVVTGGEQTKSDEKSKSKKVIEKNVNVEKEKVNNVIVKKETMKEKLLRLKYEKEQTKNILPKVIDEKEQTQNILDILPKDVIVEIINNLNSKSIASFLTSTKKLSVYARSYQESIRKQAIKRELKHVNNNVRSYFSSKILDLKVGDRVIYNGKNYKIVTIVGNKGGMMEHVDVFGKMIGGMIKYSIVKMESSWGPYYKSNKYL